MGVEDLAGCSSAHEVAVIRPSGVVVDEPGVDLGAELGETVESASVECGSPAFLQRGALEAFTDRVVVRGSGWGPMVGDAQLGESGVERGAELGSVVGQHSGDGDAEATQFGDHPAEEPFAMSVFDGPRNTSQIAQRVAVSTAVSCQTGPTPLSLPMKKLSRATRSPGLAAK